MKKYSTDTVACMKRRKATIETGVLVWIVGDVVTECALHPSPCPFCGLQAIVALPEAIRAKQPDDTNAVCHPVLGGCNYGFACNVGTE